MATKSYTLADTTTATVNVGENGIELKEALDAISKAIKAKVITTAYNISKPIPRLELGEWRTVDTGYAADILYSGDGELSTTNGTISDNALTVGDVLDVFSGVISASEGVKSAPTKCYFEFATAAGMSSTESGESSTVPKGYYREPSLVLRRKPADPNRWYVEWEGGGTITAFVNMEQVELDEENSFMGKSEGAYSVLVLLDSTDTYARSWMYIPAS